MPTFKLLLACWWSTLAAALQMPCGHVQATSARAVRTTMARLAELDSSDDAPDTADQSALFAALSARVSAIETECEERWRKAECKSSINLALETWVRRLDVEWPRAAIGTADGLVMLADLEQEKELVRQQAHPRYIESAESARDMRMLYGEYDGGGLTAIAIHGDFIVSAGRDGGARLWHIGPEKLDDRGELRDSGDATVSSIVISSSDAEGEGEEPAFGCWTGSLDGIVRYWQVQPPLGRSADDPPPAPRCSLRFDAGAPVLDMAILKERSLLACVTTAGEVRLLSTVDGSPRGVWQPTATGVSARSVALTRLGNGACIIVGGGDGTMHFRQLADAVDADEQIDVSQPPSTMLPAHGGSVVALTPLRAVAGERESGLLASGAHDGTLRMWDLNKAAEGTSQCCLYGLGGYKVWLGSVCTDARRLVSDGRDNCILVHDFSDEAAQAQTDAEESDKDD
mmetsp:Transcript_2726/g.7527  ORF Transcript_2726/g.7527 Transcript_2726/m.7527 type:complete len:457 (+) Transcript_2726:58-1428(+)